MPYLPLLGILREYFGLKDVPEELLARHRVRDVLQTLDPQLLTHLPSFQSLLSLAVEDEAVPSHGPQEQAGSGC